MKVTNSPYIYLGTAFTAALLALFWLPQMTSSAVSPLPQPEVPVVETPSTDYLPDDYVYKVVDQMPMWPGCEDEGAYPARKACADKKMLEYIYSNIRYPDEARENGVEGMAVVSFVVEKDGRVNEVRIVRDPGAGTGREAAKVVKMMDLDNIFWVPGRQNGRHVRVQFNLPVKFKLE